MKRAIARLDMELGQVTITSGNSALAFKDGSTTVGRIQTASTGVLIDTGASGSGEAFVNVGKLSGTSSVEANADKIILTASEIHFFGTAFSGTKPTVTGSRGGNAALASLLTALHNLGLITNSTSA